jgi:hypothetical protein
MFPFSLLTLLPSALRKALKGRGREKRWGGKEKSPE